MLLSSSSPCARLASWSFLLLLCCSSLAAADWDRRADLALLEADALARDTGELPAARAAALAAYRLGCGSHGGLVGDPGWHWWRLAAALAPSETDTELRAWRLLATGRARDLLALSDDLPEPEAWACLADGDWRRLAQTADTPLVRYARAVAHSRSGLIEALPMADRFALLRCEADPHGLITHASVLKQARANATELLPQPTAGPDLPLAAGYQHWAALDRAWRGAAPASDGWRARLRRTRLAAARDRLLIALVLHARARCRDATAVAERNYCRDLPGRNLAATMLRAEAWSPAPGVVTATAVDALLAAGTADNLAPGIIAGLAADLHASQPAIVERRGDALMAATTAARPATRARWLARLQQGLDDGLASAAGRIADELHQRDPWRPALQPTREAEPRKRSSLPDFTLMQPVQRYRSRQIDYEPGTTPWFANAADDHFAIRWHGELLIDRAGDYRFELESDDGSRLSINETELIDNDGMHGMETVTSDPVHLTAGAHAIVVEFFEAAGGEGCRLRWRPPGQGAFSPVPETALQAGGETGLFADYFDERRRRIITTDTGEWHVADLVERARQHLDEDHAAAVALTERAVDLAPDNILVIDLQSRLALKEGRWSTAQKLLRRGLKQGQGWQRQRFLLVLVEMMLGSGIADSASLAEMLAQAQPLLGRQRLAQAHAAQGDWQAAADIWEDLADRWGHVDLRAAALVARHGDDIAALQQALQTELPQGWWLGDHIPATGPWWWSLVQRHGPRETWACLDAMELPKTAGWRIYLADCALAIGDLARVDRLVKKIDRKDLSPAGEQRRSLLRILAKKLSRPGPGRVGSGGEVFDSSRAALDVLGGTPLFAIEPGLAELEPQAQWYVGLALAALGESDAAEEHLARIARWPATPAAPWPRYAAACREWLSARTKTTAPIPAIQPLDPSSQNEDEDDLDVDDLGAEGF